MREHNLYANVHDRKKQYSGDMQRIYTYYIIYTYAILSSKSIYKTNMNNLSHSLSYDIYATMIQYMYILSEMHVDNIVLIFSSVVNHFPSRDYYYYYCCSRQPRRQ